MPELKLCTHIKDDGEPCQAIAVHDTPYCYFHRKFYKAPALPGQPEYRVPLLETHQSIQLAATDLYQSFLSGKLSLKDANFALRILSLASRSISAIERQEKQSTEKGAPFKPVVGLSGVVPGVPTHSSSFGTAGKDTDAPKPAATAAKPAKPKNQPNPFVNPKPSQSASAEPKRGVYDPYGCLAHLKEPASK